MPRYAELQHGEAAHAPEHLAHGVPDLRLATLPARYEELLRLDLPLERDGIRRLRDFAPRLGSCATSSPPMACPRRSSTFARAIAYIRQRAALRPEERPLFDTVFSTVLGRAVAQTLGDASS